MTGVINHISGEQKASDRTNKYTKDLIRIRTKVMGKKRPSVRDQSLAWHGWHRVTVPH
jgi:hypothetical protein